MKYKIIKITLLVIAVLIIAALIFGPGIAINKLEKNSKEWVGRKLEIGDYSLNYFTGTVEINNFVLYEADDKTPFITFDTLLVNTEPYRLISNQLVIEEIGLTGLQTHLIKNDSVFNIDDLAAFYNQSTDSTETAEDTPADTTSASDPLVIKVSNIHINAKELSYSDIQLQHETKIVHLNLVVPYISWNAGGGSHAGIEFDLADNGHFTINFDLNPNSRDFHTDINIDGLNLETYKVYAEQQLNISALQGIFSTNLDIDGTLDSIEKTLVSGEMKLNDFAIHDLNKQKLIEVGQLTVGIAKIDNFNKQFVIDSVHISKPFIDFELLAEGTNFSNFVKQEPDSLGNINMVETRNDTVVNQDINLSYVVKSFVIDNGIIEFKDHTTPELFEYHLSDINMSAEAISSDADWVITYLDMLLNKRGKMKVELGFNPMKPLDLDLDYVLTNFQLSDINIYSEISTGYPFVYGEMFYTSNTKIRDGIIESENNLRINDVELGDKVQGIKSIPIKFALFLLKDKNGDVVLDVPVRGDLNNPEINVKKLIWTTFKNAIFKIVSAPVDFLAGFARIDPKDIKTIEFAYLDTTLNNRVEHQLDMLLKLENAKPGLKIEMAYFNDIEKEKDAIALDETGKIFYQKKKKDYQKEIDAFKKFIKKRTKKDSVNIISDCRELTGIQVVDSLYSMYSEIRFLKIDSYLRSKNDSTKIVIVPLNPDSPKNIESIPMFEMKYSVED